MTRAKHQFKFRAVAFSTQAFRHSFVVRTVGDWGRVALSCAPVRALLRTHGLESTLTQRCAHGSASVGALPWAQPTLCAPDWLNFALICNIADGLLDYAKVIAYLATHSQTNTYRCCFFLERLFVRDSTTEDVHTVDHHTVSSRSVSRS